MSNDKQWGEYDQPDWAEDVYEYNYSTPPTTGPLFESRYLTSSRSPAEHAGTASAPYPQAEADEYESGEDDEEQGALDHAWAPQPDMPRSALPTPHIHGTEPGPPSTQPEMSGGFPEASAYDMGGMRNSPEFDDLNKYAQDDPALEGVYFGTPNYLPYQPAEGSSSGGSAERSSPGYHSQVSARPSPAAQPPTPAAMPHQRGEYSGAQYAGKYFSPHQQGTGRQKRPHDEVSPSSSEGKRGKGKQRQESPWQQQGGQGQSSAPPTGHDVVDLTESPAPSASFIDPRQAGGGYNPQYQGESSAQGAVQHQYDPMQSINPDMLLVDQRGAGAEYAQPQGESSFPGAEWRQAGAPRAAPEPVLPKDNLRWEPHEDETLEELMSGHQELRDVAQLLETIFQRKASACQYRWASMQRYWGRQEDNCLRSLPQAPENWDAFAEQYNRWFSTRRTTNALRTRFALLSRSNEYYNLGNRRI